jgi:hypothetical protein
VEKILEKHPMKYLVVCMAIFLRRKSCDCCKYVAVIFVLFLYRNVGYLLCYELSNPRSFNLRKKDWLEESIFRVVFLYRKHFPRNLSRNYTWTLCGKSYDESAPSFSYPEGQRVSVQKNRDLFLFAFSGRKKHNRKRCKLNKHGNYLIIRTHAPCSA